MVSQRKSVMLALPTWAAIVLLLVLQLSPIGPQHLVQAEDHPTYREMQSLSPGAVERNTLIAPKVESQLSQLVHASASEGLREASQDAGVHIQEDMIRVVVSCIEEDALQVVDVIEDSGATVEAIWRGLIQCLVLPEMVENLALTESVVSVSLPDFSFPCTQSQGLELIEADEWHTAGLNGTGLKIGVLDSGFAGYASLLGTELPGSVATRWPISGGSGTSVHGTACAEIVHDLAPGASLYLARYDGSVDWQTAAQWLIDQEVDVISCSIGWLGTGPRDGTSYICAPIEAARDAGILWSQSSGNSAQRHWMGPWNDTDIDGVHDFGTPSQPDESNAIGLNAGSEIYISLTWDDTWGSAANDYDLLVFYGDDEAPYVWSENDQAGGFPAPHESIQFTAPWSGWYHIVVVEWETSRDCVLELFTTASTLQYQVAAGSITDNAASPDALTVGAVDWASPNELETFSSRGPTVDERIKPDMVAPDRVDTETYGAGSFAGTSAAAPHVAAAAALVKEAYPSYWADEIQAFLENNAVDLGTPGRDNLYGSGRLLLPAILDFGDSPDPSYPTLLASNGARHITVPGFHLGASVDAEDDGQPNAGATGDDTLDENDDEDGVVFTSVLAAGEQATVNVTASAAGFLDAWIDFNVDGDWDDAGEQVFSSQLLAAGVNYFSYSVPEDMSATEYIFSRFRFSSIGGLSYTGQADDGEVEDHKRLVSAVTIELPLQTGWNMVSVPIQADDMSTGTIFAGSVAVYTWDPELKSYTSPDTIDPMRGYWVAVTGDKTITITGTPVTEHNCGICQGWNMIGSTYGDTLDISHLTTDADPDPLVRNAIYWWNPENKSYESTLQITSGRGYWLAANETCMLTF